MQCVAVRERLMEFALGELSTEKERNLMLEHLQGCAPCTAELQEIRDTLGTLDVWEIDPPGHSMLERTLSALESERQAEH